MPISASFICAHAPDYVGLPTVRCAPCCMATGQAAGVAAALGIPSYDVLKTELVRQGAL